MITWNGPIMGQLNSFSIFQKLSKNSNARGVALGGMFKLRFDWYIKLLHIKQLNTAATSSRSFSIFSSNSWRKMSSGGNRTRSVRSSEKYRSIRHTNISEVQTGIFGRMERALKDFSCAVSGFFVYPSQNIRPQVAQDRGDENNGHA